jgi:hypothetical protein
MSGNEGTPADEADVRVAFHATDVRCAATSTACPSGTGSDFIGKLLARADLRVTDKLNGPGENEDGTLADTSLELPVTCVATGDATFGGDCALNTTMDALMPGIARESSRSIWQLGQIEVLDPGPNGTGFGAGCPSACGDGDERTFMRQGVFVP